MRAVTEDAVGADELQRVPRDPFDGVVARIVEDHRRGEARLDQEVADDVDRVAAATGERDAVDDDPLRAERSELILPARQPVLDVVGDPPA
jgi:hypothetical protein